MRTAADTFEETHPIVAGMVEMAQRRVGSRMTAYQEVGRTIGQSGSWVRKLIGRQPVAIEKHVFENIMAAYRSLCERVEADRDLERARFLALGKVTHETDEGADHEVGVAQRRRPAGPRSADPLVAGSADGGAQ